MKRILKNAGPALSAFTKVKQLPFKYCRLWFCLAFTGCASTVPQPTQVVLSDFYQAPQSYDEHRAQQQIFVSTTGDIAYTDHGDGKVLLLLHGVPTSSWLYRKIIPQLQQDFRVVSVDLLGYGSSAKPEDDGSNYGAVAQAQRVSALLNFLSIREYAIMMHDMGGLVAWELLRLAPKSASELIIQNTIVHQDGFNSPDIKPGFMARQLTKAYSSRMTSAAILDVTFRNLGLGGEYQLSESECHGYVKPLREGSSPALYAFFTSLNDELFQHLEDNRQLFDDYRGKALVLWGGKDDVLTTQQIPFLRDHLRIPDEDIHIYPDNQHFLVEEIPGEVITQVRDFLDRDQER